VAFDDRVRSVQLIGDDQAHQHVRQSEGDERPALVGELQHFARVAITQLVFPAKAGIQ
jgi:hypothetical protein